MQRPDPDKSGAEMEVDLGVLHQAAEKMMQKSGCNCAAQSCGSYVVVGAQFAHRCPVTMLFGRRWSRSPPPGAIDEPTPRKSRDCTASVGSIVHVLQRSPPAVFRYLDDE